MGLDGIDRHLFITLAVSWNLDCCCFKAWTSLWLHPTLPLEVFMTLHKSPSHSRACQKKIDNILRLSITGFFFCVTVQKYLISSLKGCNRFSCQIPADHGSSFEKSGTNLARFYKKIWLIISQNIVVLVSNHEVITGWTALSWYQNVSLQKFKS